MNANSDSKTVAVNMQNPVSVKEQNYRMLRDFDNMVCILFVCVDWSASIGLLVEFFFM